MEDDRSAVPRLRCAKNSASIVLSANTSRTSGDVMQWGLTQQREGPPMLRGQRGLTPFAHYRMTPLPILPHGNMLCDELSDTLSALVLHTRHIAKTTGGQ